MSSVDTRSEILFVTDAQDCNPNGNPLANNRPRRDPETGQGIITDVRLKRYLRDQLLDDGYDIYMKKLGGESRPRTTLALDVLGEGIEEADDIEDLEDVGERFLEHATDVRYFGATLSFESRASDEDESLQTALQGSFPTQYQGPVQFMPAKSLNEVEENEEFDSLTSVIATGEGSRQGGFDLDDHRIVYGIFPFYGLVDEASAADTNLSGADVERLDTLCWRALKNQTTSRSKLGQAPRLYLRVEYDRDQFHIGGLQNMLSLGADADEPLRSIGDVVVDATELVDTLAAHSDRITQVRLCADDRLTLTTQSDDDAPDTFPATDLADRLESVGVTTDRIDVYEERDLA
jgi:CRISPR-associated protein Csh2